MQGETASAINVIGRYVGGTTSAVNVIGRYTGGKRRLQLMLSVDIQGNNVCS